MKILVINPNSDKHTTEIIRQKAEKVCAKDTKITCVELHTTPVLISSFADCVRGADEMMNLIKGNEKDYDGFVIGCFSDPNIDVIKEITKKPVIGIAEASMKYASVLSDKFALVSTNWTSAARKKALARKYYCNEQLEEIIVPNSGELRDILEGIYKVKEKGIGVVILGCANYALLDAMIEHETGVKVYDGLACALGYIESMVRYESYKTSHYDIR